MRCPGLHCPGCGDSGGIIAVAVPVMLLLGGAAYIVPRLAWLAGITAGCLVLSVVLALAVVPRLARWSGARDAAAYPDRRPAQLRAEPSRERPAIPQVVNINLYGADVATAAAVIRKALPEGGDGDAESR